MTTKEEKAPTAGDVDWWHQEVHDGSNLRTHSALGAIANLRDLALLGVQVPGLEADIAALQRDLQATTEAARHQKTRADENEKSSFSFAARAREARDEVSALQARVAELTRERDEANGRHERQMLGAKQAVEAVRRIQARAQSERDALRAQVDTASHAAQQLGAWVKFRLETDGLDTCTCAPLERCAWCRATKDVDALSAPPAEEKEPSCGNCGEAEDTHPTLCNEHDASDE